MAAPTLKLLLGGDLMLGRGIDQLMPQHCDPALTEPVAHSALHYVALAERRSGTIQAPFAAATPWGEALAWMEHFGAERRIVNLETAITTAPHPWPGKAVHYRMHPANVASLQAAAIDACCLANNHVLDWGFNGLADTLRSLRRAGIAAVGAGLNPHQAQAPIALPLAANGRLLLFAWAFASSGVPMAWAADRNHPGVALLSSIDSGAVKWLARCINRQRRSHDRVVVSLHWGANWVPVVPEQHRWLARQLIELAGVDVVFGHSSHHPLPLELYRGRLILYGCGDLINDTEGLPAHGPWRSDLVCLYGLELERDSGRLQALELHPFQLRGFQLQQANSADRALLERQMGLESLQPSWRCQRHGSGWRLVPSCGTTAPKPRRSPLPPQSTP